MEVPPLRASDLGAVFVGGAVGASARVALVTWFPVLPGAFPWTTFLENVVGAFLLALVLTTLARRHVTDRRIQLFVGTGALGAFTTYSTVAVELDGLLRAGGAALAATYAVASLAVGLGAAAVGLWLARRISPIADGREDER